jgi:hypothetical protein
MSSDIATGFGIKFLYSRTNTTFQILVAVLNYTNLELRITPKEIKQKWVILYVYNERIGCSCERGGREKRGFAYQER